MDSPSAEEAILRTLLYADIFDYPLTPGEIHHFLIGASHPAEVVLAALTSSPWLAARVTRSNGYFALHDRGAIALIRPERQRSSAELWPRARRWAYLVGCLPFVRMVAVTGALAVNNASPDDDIDYLIVTLPGRVWLTRAMVVALVRVARALGVGLCPNYVLAESALAQTQRNLFVAHDLAQMVPLVGHGVYAQMRAVNQWAVEYLPHAVAPLCTEPDLAPRGWLGTLKRWAERLLSGQLGEAFEGWERRRKLRKFASAARMAGSAAELDAERVKGHFDDHGGRILREFEARIAHYFK